MQVKMNFYLSLTAYFDLKAAAELLAYLGYNNYYDENQTSAFNGNDIIYISIL